MYLQVLIKLSSMKEEFTGTRPTFCILPKVHILGEIFIEMMHLLYMQHGNRVAVDSFNKTINLYYNHD